MARSRYTRPDRQRRPRGVTLAQLLPALQQEQERLRLLNAERMRAVAEGRPAGLTSRAA